MVNPPDQLLHSLDRALNIMELIVKSDNSFGITELSNITGVHKSTIYRVLATLNYRGYVKKDIHGQYKSGIKMLELGACALNNLDLRKQVKPYLIELQEKSKETIHLGVLDNYEVVYIDKVETAEVIRMYSRIGKRAEAHCTSLGKVLLAFSPTELVEKYIESKGLTKHTKNTITEPEKLKQELKKIQHSGYSVDEEEITEGIWCIGGPIFNYKGEVIASFSISVPVIRLTDDVKKELKKLVINYSRKISISFGFKYNNE